MNKNQQHASIENYHHISTVVNQATTMMDKVRSGELKPLITSSLKEQEKIGGYYPSDQVVIAGRTGTGKSTKALIDLLDFCNPELNPSYTDNILILFDSYEMVGWRNVLRMVSRKAEVEVKALLDYKQKLDQERFETFKKLAGEFKSLPIYITNKPRTPRQWEEDKKNIQGKFPTKKIINLFDHTRLGLKEDDKREEENISNFMFRGIHLKNNFDMIMIWLSQMNRNIETNINRDKLGTHLPVSSDIFGSDAVFQCADVVMALHRPGMYGLEEFEGIPTGISKSNPDKPDDLLLEVILKQREGWTGTLTLRHNLAINHVEDYYPREGAQTKLISSKSYKDNKLNEPDF